MTRTAISLAGAFLAVGLFAGAKPAHKLEAVKKLPDGLSKKVAATLNSAGKRVTGAKGAVVDVWFAKSVPVKPGFEPTLSVKYPFMSGELIGAMQVGKGQTFTDFRGQELKPGVYTLRYGQQPQDGNHIGTSELSDFLLALPAKTDTDPKPINVLQTLYKDSAKSVGATHPAIFSLLPAGKDAKPGLKHDADKDFWIFTASVTGAAKGQKSQLPLRMVVIGKFQE